MQPMATLPSSNDRVINVRYVRAPTMAEFPINGVYGGLASTGQIAMAVYTERMALPDTSAVSITFDPTDSLSPPVIADTPVLSIDNERIVNAVLHFDVDFARVLRAWLDDKIASFDEMAAQ